MVSNNNDDKYVKSSDEGSISRYEWIQMLCEKAGLTEYENNTPYFSDVNQGNDFFPFVQSAVEWKVLSDDSDFEGEGIASGRFIALTAMKALGENKVRIYTESLDNISDKDYLDLAVENDLVEKSDFQMGLSKEKCEWILERLFDELYFEEFWRDDYLEVAYCDNIIELGSEDILECNNDSTEIKLTKERLSSVSKGTVIVFKNHNNGIMIAKNVSDMDEEGNLKLADVELEQVIESLITSDIEQIAFDDIATYYGLEEGAEAENLRNAASDWNTVDVKFHEGDYKSEGFKLSISTEEERGKNKLSIKITDNHSGKSYYLPINKEVSLGSNYLAEIDFDKIVVGAQILENFLIDVEYAEVAVDAHATYKGEIKSENEEKILLYETTVPLAGGIAGIRFELYLVISAGGSISLSAEMPMQACIQYDKDAGFHNIKQDLSVKNPEIKANCEVNTMLRFEPTVFLFGIFNAIDVEADIGATAEAEAVMRPNLQTCIDTSVSYPIVKLSVCKDGDKESFARRFGSMEWEIISSKNAPCKIELHFEYRPDETGQFVDGCTYREVTDADQDNKLMNQASATMNNTYTTKYGNADMEKVPTFSFDYPENWSIISETYDQANDICPLLDIYAQEVVALTNERGVTVNFIRIDDSVFSLGGMGAIYQEYSASIVEDKVSYEKARVVKIQPMLEAFQGTNLYDEIDNGDVRYALISEDYDVDLYAIGNVGFYEMLGFKIEPNSVFNFYAESPDGKFTENEEKEVIAILASFRSFQ